MQRCEVVKSKYQLAQPHMHASYYKIFNGLEVQNQISMHANTFLMDV